jgi:hypothetical protein
MSRVFNAKNLSTERAELIKEIQELCQTKICHSIKIENESAIETILIVGKWYMRLDFRNLNLVHEPYIPSKIIICQFPGKKLSKDDIEKGIDILIQTFENNSFARISDKFEDCSVCMELTNFTTKCHHPLCKKCWKKIEKENEKGQNTDSSNFKFPKCPICRKSQH